MKITRKQFGLAMMLAALILNLTWASAACAVERRDEGANGNEQSHGKAQKPRSSPPPTTQPSPVTEGEENLEKKVPGEIKELAAGGYSSVKESFVLVARDAQTYARLRELNERLPELGADFFKSNAVVAAFLGQRSSGGYSVQITRGDGGAAEAGGLLRITEQSPPKDAMVTMALTSAFRVVSVPVDEESPLALELDATWREAARPYKVGAGEFTRTGGFAGRREQSNITGDIRVMRHARLATLFFDLRGAGAEGKYALQDMATGAISPAGDLTLTRLDPGSFVPPPRNPLRAQGKFGGNSEDTLSLTFETLETKVADGFVGQGKLEAKATAPPPRKRAVDGDDPM